MADSIVKLRLDSGDYDAKIKKAREGLLQMEKQFRAAGKSLAAADKDQLAYIRSMGQMETSARGLKGKVAELTRAYSDLRGMYNNLSADEKRSQFGRNMNKSLEEMKDRVHAAKSELRQINDEIADTAKESQNTSGILSNLKNTIAGVFAVQQITAFAKEVISVRSEMQSLQTSFEVLLGDKGKAEAMFSEIKTFAAKTPMQMGDLAKGAQTMLGFGIEDTKIMDYLKAIGDISMGDANKFNSLALAFSQMSATGKLMGQDLNQMINQGFNPLKVISEQTGKSIGELKEEMSKGKITAEMVQQAFLAAASGTGQFAGMLDKMSQTQAGALSNLQGAWTDFKNSLGEAISPAIVSVSNSMTDLLNNSINLTKAIKEVVIAYGTYKAAMMLATAATSGMTAAEVAHYAALVATEKAQKLLNATMKLNPYMAVAAACAALAVAVYEVATSETEMEKATKRVEQANSSVSKATEEELTKLQVLNDQLQQNKKGTDDWKAAKDAVIQQYGQYDSKLATEINRVGDLSTSYDKLASAIRKAMAAKQLKTFYDTNEDTTQQTIQDQREKIYDYLVKKKGRAFANKNIGSVNDYISTGKPMNKALTDMMNETTNNPNMYNPNMVVYPSVRIKSNAVLENAINQARSARVAGNQALTDYKRMNGISDKQANEILYGIGSETSTTTTTTTPTTVKPTKTGKVKTVKTDDTPKPETGSLDWINAQISELKKAQGLTSDVQEVAALQKQIDDWKNKIKERNDYTEALNTPDLSVKDALKEWNDKLNEDFTKSIQHRLKYDGALQGLGGDIPAPSMSDANISTLTSGLQEQLKNADFGSPIYQSIKANLADTNALGNLLQVAVNNGLDVAEFQNIWQKILNGEDIADADWAAIESEINAKLAEMNIDQIKLNVKTGNITKLSDETKMATQEFQQATNAIGQLGSALNSIEDPVAKVFGLVAQAIASVASSFAQALMPESKKGVWAWIAAAVAGTATMISTISAIKSATSGTYDTGGIVPGNNFHKGSVQANVESGELILNHAQQDVVASKLQENRQKPVEMSARISGEDIIIASNNWGKRTGRGEIVFTRR